MNYSFNPVHLVNTYGAFGSITRMRHEIVIEGTDAETIRAATEWREYEFKGKPGGPSRLPPQVAPYRVNGGLGGNGLKTEKRGNGDSLSVRFLCGSPTSAIHLRSPRRRAWIFMFIAIRRLLRKRQASLE